MSNPLLLVEKRLVEIHSIVPGVTIIAYAKNKFDLIDEKTANLLAGATHTLTNGALVYSDYQFIRGGCLMDQNGTLYVEFSPHGINWIAQMQHNYVANNPLAFKVSVVCPFCRVRFVNGIVNQTSCQIVAYATS